MGRLKILMADDQQFRIEEARKALKEMAHEVIAVGTFDEAMTISQTDSFDIAVVDLGWYTDTALRKKVSKEEAAVSGWKILESIKARNPETVRILYSARTEESGITLAATELGVYSILKSDTEAGKNLADVIKVIAHRLAIESELKLKIQELGLELEKARALAADLEGDRNSTDSDERKFRRVLITTVITPTMAFVLFIAAWLLTRQMAIAIAAFLGGSFLSLAALRAIGAVSSADLKYLGKLLPSLFRKT